MQFQPMWQPVYDGQQTAHYSQQHWESGRNGTPPTRHVDTQLGYSTAVPQPQSWEHQLTDSGVNSSQLEEVSLFTAADVVPLYLALMECYPDFMREAMHQKPFIDLEEIITRESLRSPPQQLMVRAEATPPNVGNVTYMPHSVEAYNYQLSTAQQPQSKSALETTKSAVNKKKRKRSAGNWRAQKARNTAGSATQWQPQSNGCDGCRPLQPADNAGARWAPGFGVQPPQGRLQQNQESGYIWRPFNSVHSQQPPAFTESTGRPPVEWLQLDSDMDVASVVEVPYYGNA